MMNSTSSNNALRVNFVPDSWDGSWVIECNIVLRFLEVVLGREVEVVSSAEEAELSLVYLFPIRDELERSKRRSSKRFTRLREANTIEDIIRRLPVAEKVLVFATENLDHPVWAEIGILLKQSRVPRLTFYPEEVDPGGARVPYWWNYLDWPKYPRPDVEYGRYGRLYSLERLLSPLKEQSTDISRKHSAVYISSHRSGIRDSILRIVEHEISVEIFGGAGGKRFDSPKLELLRRYRYAVASENSLGIGYVTEKLPEAWDAGCIPLGIISTPFSDFSYQALTVTEATEVASRPLLEREPDESRVLNYLSDLF